MRKPTKQQLILFKILHGYPDGIRLGELRCLFYKIHTPRRNTHYFQQMKRNSRMSSWLNTLRRDGLIYINIGYLYEPWNDLYSLTDRAKDLIK